MVALLQDRQGIAGRLSAGPYATAALVPATPWLDATPPPAPQLKREAAGRVLITPAAGKVAASYAVWRGQDGAWRFSVQPAGETAVVATTDEWVVVSSVDRLGNESARTTLAPLK
jgi:hypothetical protein